jgi:hypothetical protein
MICECEVRLTPTACLGAAQSSTAVSDSLTALAVIILACLDRLSICLCEVVDRSETSSEVGEQGASLQIFGVQSNNGRERISRSMGADKRGNSRNSGECSRKVHVV